MPLTIVLISGISTMANSTVLNFGKRYEDNISVIFDQWLDLHLGLDALSNQKILNGIYYITLVYIVLTLTLLKLDNKSLRVLKCYLNVSISRNKLIVSN